MKCPRCTNENPDDKVFCGTCGFPLPPGVAYLEERLEEKVQKAISAQFKDQRLVSRETINDVRDRVISQARNYMWLLSILFVPVILILSFLGLNTYRDFSRKVTNAEKQIAVRTREASETATQAAIKAREATDAATQAKNDIEKASHDVQEELRKVKALSEKVSESEKQTTGKFGDANKHIADQVGVLDKEVATARQQITTQQQKLASTDELVQALVSKNKLTAFHTPLTANGPSFAAIDAGDHALIYFLLEEPPIYTTLQIQWDVYLLPKLSAGVDANLVICRWNKSLGDFGKESMYVSYIPNPQESRRYRKLTVSNNVVYADGRPLPKF